jgi:hypothetical protein
MTPIAAYYLYIANEQAQAAANEYRVPRPSLLDRVRTLVLRLKSPAARKSPVARKSRVARPA